jgi:haloacetate dehalogenase
VLWYAVAARLAERYHVVLADLRGYGDSSLPEPGPKLVNYSFRVMAEDMIEVMENLGYQRFFLAGQDRGARLSHRMCLDHPDRVMKLCLLDMLPNYYVWTNVRRLALAVHGAAGAVSRNDDERRSGRMVPEGPRQRQEPSQSRIR